MRRLLILLAGLLMPASHANTAPAQPPASLSDFAAVVMASDADRETIEAAGRVAARDIETLDDEGSRLLHEAQRSFFVAFAERGFVIAGNGSLETVAASLEHAASLARRAAELEPSSESYRILADTLNQLLDIRGFGYKMFHVTDAARVTNQAVELDPTNALAHISAAAFYTSVPPALGGSGSRAREHLREAVALSDDSHFVEFLINLWSCTNELAYGSRKQAELHFARASEIYPNNWLLVRVGVEAGISTGGPGRR